MPQPQSSPASGHAVVLGAGMAGLLAARVLADRYAKVTVVDRDAVRMYDPAARKLQIFPVGSGAVSPTALGFLLGEAKLREVFELAPGVPVTSGERLSFKLRPRGDAGFATSTR